jgi:hypothetical protein
MTSREQRYVHRKRPDELPRKKKCPACGKQMHRTYWSAVSWILEATRTGAPPLSIYRCRQNSGPWHVTSR